MKRKLSCFLLAALFLFSVIGCDPRGSFSDEETQELYKEIKSDFSDDAIWDLDFTVYEQKGTKKETIAFIRQTMELLDHESEDQSIYGMWFSSKRYCRILTIKGENSVQYDGATSFIDTLDIAKYRNGSYQITVFYRNQSSDTDQRYAQIKSAPPRP